MAKRKGVNHGAKVKLGGSSVRKQKANLSNTYGIKPSSGGVGKSAVNQPSPSTPNKLSRKSALGKVRG